MDAMTGGAGVGAQAALPGPVGGACRSMGCPPAVTRAAMLIHVTLTHGVVNVHPATVIWLDDVATGNPLTITRGGDGITVATPP